MGQRNRKCQHHFRLQRINHQVHRFQVSVEAYREATHRSSSQQWFRGLLYQVRHQVRNHQRRFHLHQVHLNLLRLYDVGLHIAHLAERPKVLDMAYLSALWLGGHVLLNSVLPRVWCALKISLDTCGCCEVLCIRRKQK